MAEELAVEGLQDLLRAFGQMDKALSREVRREYRTIGQLVGRSAKSVAEEKGLRLTGKLIRGIRPAVRGATLVIQDLVRRAGFPYPQIFEGLIAGHGKRRTRAFLEPGLDRVSGRVEDAFGDMLDRLSSIGGFGGRVT